MRDKQTKEAIRRMKALKMAEGVIIQFKDEGLLNQSETTALGGGICYWPNKDILGTAREFEDEYGGLVYHIIKSVTEFGTMYSMLYVSKHEEEWVIDRDDIKNGRAYAYVYNYASCEAEIGAIGILPENGGLRRTW
jgi:hypothetical protein